MKSSYGWILVGAEPAFTSTDSFMESTHTCWERNCQLIFNGALVWMLFLLEGYKGNFFSRNQTPVDMPSDLLPPGTQKTHVKKPIKRLLTGLEVTHHSSGDIYCLYVAVWLALSQVHSIPVQWIFKMPMLQCSMHTGLAHAPCIL